MSHIRCLFCAFLLTFLPGQAIAAEPPANPDLQELLPYIDQDIHLLVWSDLSELDKAEWFRFLTAVAGQPVDSTDTAHELEAIDHLKTALRKAGCDHVYVIASLPELIGGGLMFVFPCTDPGAVKNIVEGLPLPPPAMESRIDGNVLLYGAGLRLDAASKHPNAPSKEMSQALQHSTAAAPQGIVFAPPQYIGELLQARPNNDKGAGYQAFAQLAALGKDLQWAMLAGKLPPKDLQLTVTMRDAEAAERLDQTLQNLLKQSDSKFRSQTIAYEKQGSQLFKRLGDQAEAVASLQDIRANMLGNAFTDLQTSNNMKQVAVAMHNYHEAYGQFPPQALTDANGRRLLSWRVLILPYLNQQALYEQFHLDEPWDSPHNLKLAEAIPAPYVASNQAALKPGYTRIVAPLTKDSAFGHVGKPLQFQNITDGTSGTIWFVHGPTIVAVPWSKPLDWNVDQAAYQAWLPKPDAVELVAFIDGSIREISGNIDWETFQKLLSIDGREVVDRDLNP